MSQNFLKQPERRYHHRVDACVDVRLLNVEGQEITATAANISSGGMYLPVLHEAIKKDSELEMLIHLPDQERPLKMQGEVRRVDEREKEGLAVRFKGLYNDNILAIDRFIKNKVH